MIYFKTILLIITVNIFLLCGAITSYHDINYSNLFYLIIPIMFTAVVYLCLKYQYKKVIDFQFFKLNLNFAFAIMQLGICVIIKAINFNFNSFSQANYADIRAEYIESLEGQNLSFAEQLVPLLSIYPLTYLLYRLASKKGFDFKILVMIGGLLFIGQTTGGRQILFQLLILILFIIGTTLLKRATSLIFLSTFVLFAAIITIGRFNNPDVNKAILLENMTPIEINPILKDDPEYQPLKDVVIEAGFYFSQSVPAFCNEINHVQISFLPDYILGMQPFFERQFYKAGLISVSQEVRFKKFLQLTDDSGFFPGTWASGFLDVYFNLGYFGGAIFFFLVGFLMYMCQSNLEHKATHKYRILQAFNILFMITMFMTPAFFDTTIIFTYLFILFTHIHEPNSVYLLAGR